MKILKNEKQGKIFMIPCGNRIRIINQMDIMFIRAESNYSVFIKDDKTELILCHTLEYVENILEKSSFFRCHKSFLVNLSKINEITLNKSELTMQENVKIPIARRRRKEFIKTLHKLENYTVET